MGSKGRAFGVVGVVIFGAALLLALVPPRPVQAATCWELDSREPDFAQAGAWQDVYSARIAGGGHLAVRDSGQRQHNPPTNQVLGGNVQPPAEVTYEFEPPRQICKDEPAPVKLTARGPNRSGSTGVYLLAMLPGDIVDGVKVDAKGLLDAAGPRTGRPSNQNKGFQVGRSIANSENNGQPTNIPQEQAFDILVSTEPLLFRLSVYTTSAFGPGVFEAVASFRYAKVDTTAKASVRADHIEFVQVVQDAGNTIPLVAGKRTVARVFVASTGRAPVDGVTGTLTAKREGAATITIQPKGAITAPVNYDRENIAHSLVFDIPTAVTAAGAVQFEVNVTAPGVSGEAAKDPRLKQAAAMAFKQLDNWPAEFQLVGLRICTQSPPTPLPTKDVPNPATPDGAKVVCPSDAATLQPLTGLLIKLYPVADSTIHNYIAATTPLTYRYPTNTSEGQDALIAFVRKAYDLVFGNGRIWRGDQIVGWIADSANTSSNRRETYGMSDPAWDGRRAGTQGHVMWVKDRTPRKDGALATQRTIAHEIGHNLGLTHTHKDVAAATAAGCGSVDPHTQWPPADGVTIHETGFDPAAGLVRSAKSFDLMAYCAPAQTWISPFDYNRLLKVDARRPEGVLLPGRKGAAVTAAGDYLVISGSIRKDGSGGRLDPGYIVSDSVVADESKPNGRYCVRQSGGASAGTYCFDLDFLVNDEDSEEPLNEEYFALKVPWIAGTTAVALTDGTREVARRTTAATKPTVAISAPAAAGVVHGTMPLQWSAQAAVATTVLYSFDDRETWQPLAIDMTGTRLDVDTRELAASTQVWFRVMVTDGLQSTSADVGPMQLPDGRKDGFAGAPSPASTGPTLDVRSMPPLWVLGAIGLGVLVAVGGAGVLVMRRRAR